MDVNKLLNLIKEGENEKVEFKREFSQDIAKEICAFANSEGGYLIIGVENDGRIVGY